MSQEIPILLFKTISQWENWLGKNADSQGIWMRFAKKNSGLTSISYQEALDVALCYGWIDSQVKKYDQQSYLQKFTPRRAKSIWSKVNTERVQKLIDQGKMQPSGLLEIEKAKADGRWEAAYHPPSTMEPPKEFLQVLEKNKTAYIFYESLSRANKYAIAWRLQTAKKEETRVKRMKQILEMLERKEKFH